MEKNIHINDCIPTPLDEDAINNIVNLSNQVEIIEDEAFKEHTKSEKFMWSSAACFFCLLELGFRGHQSFLAGIFNVDFAMGAGIIAFVYLIYMWWTLNKSSKSKYENASQIRKQSEKRYGVRIIKGDCVVIDIDDHSYFFDVPNMIFSFRTAKPKNR